MMRVRTFFFNTKIFLAKEMIRAGRGYTLYVEVHSDSLIDYSPSEQKATKDGLRPSSIKPLS